jgi:hypothetical protein
VVVVLVLIAAAAAAAAAVEIAKYETLISPRGCTPYLTKLTNKITRSANQWIFVSSVYDDWRFTRLSRECELSDWPYPHLPMDPCQPFFPFPFSLPPPCFICFTFFSFAFWGISTRTLLSLHSRIQAATRLLASDSTRLNPHAARSTLHLFPSTVRRGASPSSMCKS